MGGIDNIDKNEENTRTEGDEWDYETLITENRIKNLIYWFLADFSQGLID